MDKKKIIKITSIVGVILAIAIIFPLNLTYGSFNKTADLIITENYNSINEINITTMDSDIEIVNMDIENVKLDVYDRNDDKIEIDDKNNILNIINKNSCRNCEKSKIRITIPTSSDIKLNLLSDSGDIKIENASYAKVSTDTGNIVVNNINTFMGETTSGNLLIESLNGSIKYKTNSGKVIINKAVINNDSNIETNTGKINIESINNIRVRVTSFNSQATVKSNRNSNIILDVKTYSGIINIQ